MSHAGVRQQDQPLSGRFQLMQHRHDRFIQPENVACSLAEFIESNLFVCGLTDLIMKLFFGDLAALQFEFATFIEKKRLCLSLAPAAQPGNVSTHLFMRKMHEDVAHIKETRLDCH